MAKLRKFVAYRRLKRPYTRRSKFRNKNYIKVGGSHKVISFVIGDPAQKFTHKIDLVSKEEINLRENAIESARQTANKPLETKVGKGKYCLRILVYPHHVMRENPLAAGAGADRMSTGMSAAFGKPIGFAARIKKGQSVVSLNINKENLEVGKHALKRASYKFPGSYLINIAENK